jgi:Rrf2 family protein
MVVIGLPCKPITTMLPLQWEVVIMKLSKRGEYGLRALIDLAEAQRSSDSDDGVVQIKEIAERQGIPAKFLEQILLTLKNAGLLHSRMGVGGGYYLARVPEEISMGAVVRVLDGPLAPIRCVSQSAYEPCGCPDEETCGLRLTMLDVRNAIAEILDRTTLADALARIDAARAQLGV